MIYKEYILKLKLDLISFIKDNAYLKGKFKLRSGIISDKYLDKYIIESSPLALHATCHLMYEMFLKNNQIGIFNYLAGLEVGGIPIVTLLSYITNIPSLFVRKKSKEYGTCKFLEGKKPENNSNILLVEDVVTTGGQIIKSANDIRNEGYIVENVISIIDREQGGKQNLENNGIKLYSVLTLKEIEWKN